MAHVSRATAEASAMLALITDPARAAAAKDMLDKIAEQEARAIGLNDDTRAMMRQIEQTKKEIAAQEIEIKEARRKLEAATARLAETERMLARQQELDAWEKELERREAPVNAALAAAQAERAHWQGKLRDLEAITARH